MKADKKLIHKDRWKIIRGTLQGLFLLALLLIAIRAIFTMRKFTPYEEMGVPTAQESPGFIAISYFGVDRDGTGSLINVPLLEKHLRALRDSGYVTISQADVLAYLNEGKPLPERSLYLMFEDGRRDTTIFAQAIMETFNFRGTIMSYADKFDTNGSKFLTPDELIDLQKSTFWELGSNGYRLAYINVFDRDGNYLGEMDSQRFSEVAPTLRRDYDHYLMDFIRDSYRLPKETRQQMTERIAGDYDLMREVYTKELGQIPQVYVLMHANTRRFGTNDMASEVNARCIPELFRMNFNREGTPLNGRENPYDLTRMQPQAYWSTNHLMMRIWDDTRQPVHFVQGDAEKSIKWSMLSGAAEFYDNVICLTTLPNGMGRLRLREADITDLVLSARLTGNQLGSQSILLHADAARTQYLEVRIKDNRLSVYEETGGTFTQLADIDLNPSTDANSDETGIPLDAGGNRRLDLTLQNETLNVWIDGVQHVAELAVSPAQGGSVFLESGLGGEGYSQRNLTDHVYDGVFEDLQITDPAGNILFTSRLSGWDAFAHQAGQRCRVVINWFINNL